jgi:beta-phosphoglucomutase
MSFGLFFDFDGTIADTEPLHWRGWVQALAPLGLDLTWEEFERMAVGVPDSLMGPVWSKHFDGAVTDANFPMLLNAKRTSFRELDDVQNAFPAANLQLLANLPGPACLVTMSTRADIEMLLGRVSRLTAFQHLVCVDDVVNPKPDPEAYLKAMSLLGVERGVAFEDSPRGMQSARAAGLEVVEVKHPTELPDLFARWWSGSKK